MIPSYASGNLSGSQIVQKDKVRLALLGIFDRPRQGQPTDVQRLFSMFPSGPPGIALLLLRVSVAFPVLLHCYARRDAMAVMVLAVFFLLALMLLGPGAYSLDAMRFGRRVVVLPSGDD